MSVYTVKSVGAEPRQWSSSHGGTFLAYKVDLEEEDGKLAAGVEWNRKPESNAPAVGDRIAGHLEDGQFGPKFKMDYEATKELGQPGGSSSPAPRGGKEWKPESQYDPEKTARIGRAHAQHMAILTLDAMGAFDTNAPEQLHRELGEWTDYFENDVDQAGQAASQAQGGSRPPQEGASLPSASPGSDSPSAEKTDLEMAIADADSFGSVSAQARGKMADYMLSQLPDGDRERACNQLTNKADQTTQGQTLRAMKQRTEKWIGGPLPEPTGPEDDIPFARPGYPPLFGERGRWRV